MTRGAPWEIREGDALSVLATVPDGVADCVVTSPPYWGLRDYGVSGQIGLEETPDEYVAKLVDVFREVRRVLRDDGTLWLNLGDSYCAAARGSASPETSTLTNPARILEVTGSPIDKSRGGAGQRLGHNSSFRRDRAARMDVQHKAAPEIKPKDLVGIPWLVAFSLRADGWFLRSDIVWAKPNPTPESIKDRPTKSHEYLFLLAKSERYYYNADAIREPDKGSDHPRSVLHGQPALEPSGGLNRAHSGLRCAAGRQGKGRNKRDVWTIGTEAFPGAHFAVMPTALARPCILAGARRGGLVVDPFAGTGTVGEVSGEEHRRFLGVDLNPKYVAMARARVGRAYSGGPLFEANGAT